MEGFIVCLYNQLFFIDEGSWARRGASKNMAVSNPTITPINVITAAVLNFPTNRFVKNKKEKYAANNIHAPLAKEKIMPDKNNTNKVLLHQGGRSGGPVITKGKQNNNNPAN